MLTVLNPCNSPNASINITVHIPKMMYGPWWAFIHYRRHWDSLLLLFVTWGSASYWAATGSIYVGESRKLRKRWLFYRSHNKTTAEAGSELCCFSTRQLIRQHFHPAESSSMLVWTNVELSIELWSPRRINCLFLHEVIKGSLPLTEEFPCLKKKSVISYRKL